MEQPFLNQNPNNINQINTVNQGNIYIQENQQQNQPNNPLDMNPPGMISSQENPLNINKINCLLHLKISFLLNQVIQQLKVL